MARFHASGAKLSTNFAFGETFAPLKTLSSRQVFLTPLAPDDCEARLRALCVPHARARCGDLVGSVGAGYFFLHRLYNIRPTQHGSWGSVFGRGAFGVAVAQGSLAPGQGGTRIDLRFGIPGDAYVALGITPFVGAFLGVAVWAWLEEMGWSPLLVSSLAMISFLFVSTLGLWWLLAFRRRSLVEAEVLSLSIADATMALPEGVARGAGYRVALAEPSIESSVGDADARNEEDVSKKSSA